MASTKDQRAAGRRAIAAHSMKVDVETDGEDELWTPRRADGAKGTAVRVTPSMSRGDVERALGAACRALANG